MCISGGEDCEGIEEMTLLAESNMLFISAQKFSYRIGVILSEAKNLS